MRDRARTVEFERRFDPHLDDDRQPTQELNLVLVEQGQACSHAARVVRAQQVVRE